MCVFILPLFVYSINVKKHVFTQPFNDHAAGRLHKPIPLPFIALLFIFVCTHYSQPPFYDSLFSFSFIFYPFPCPINGRFQSSLMNT